MFHVNTETTDTETYLDAARAHSGTWRRIAKLAGSITRDVSEDGSHPGPGDYVRAAAVICGPAQARWDNEYVRQPLLELGATLVCLECAGDGGSCGCGDPERCRCEPCQACNGAGEVGGEP